MASGGSQVVSRTNSCTDTDKHAYVIKQRLQHPKLGHLFIVKTLEQLFDCLWRMRGELMDLFLCIFQ